MTVTLDEALQATAETDAIDFKKEFNPSIEGEWCEILKDILAMGNSGGGAIVIGVDSDGYTVGVEPTIGKQVDPANIGDKIRKYTSGNDPRCSASIAKRASEAVLVILVDACMTPVAFEKAGTYNVGAKPKCAFNAGTFYFRHNTRSEPGTTEDIAAAIEREVKRRREEWLGNIRQVMEAPPGSKITFRDRVAFEGSATTSVRLTNDANAAPLAYRSRDLTHPFRFNALRSEVTKRLPAGGSMSTGDLLAIRRAYQADQNPNWADVGRYGPTQYSQAFADWLVEQCSRDPRFGAKAKMKARREGR